MRTKRTVLFSGLLGAAVVVSRFPAVSRRLRGLAARVEKALHARMGRMLEKMPEDFPPRLIMSTLPRLTQQNTEILSLLREQNGLLRKSAATREPTTVI